MDAEDLAAQFAKHDNLGDDSSLWLRPLRMLMEQGKPPGQMIIVAFGPTRDGDLPFGVFTSTDNNRLIFWPILPKQCQVIDEDGTLRALDHVTLDFPSRKMHFTWFNADGSRGHHSSAWRLHEFDDVGLAFWMRLVVRWSVLKEQDRLIHRKVNSPKNDVERRKAEFTRYAQNITLQKILLPPSEPEGDYVYSVIYVRTDRRNELQLSPKHVLPGGNIDDVIDGWPDGEKFDVQAMTIRVGEQELLIATACPPGHLKDEVMFGFPNSKGRDKR